MQYSIVQYSKVRELEDFRIDSDYFHPDYLQKERIIVSQKCAPLETLSLKVSDFGAYSQTNIVEYKESGKYIFIRNKDVRGFFLDRMDRVYVDEDVYNQLSLHLEKHDIVIQRTGTLGKAGILMDEDLPSTANQNLAQIRVNKKRISPFYLLAFLNSDFGISVFERLKTGNVQPWLNLKQIKTLTIPILTTRFQEIIETIVFSAYENEVRSGNSYQEAEQIILSELGLLNWKPQHTLSFIKNFSSTQSAERIDAEYYQPMYEEIIEKVKHYKNGYKPINDCVKIKDKNFVPKADVTYKYIELANISANGNINGFIEAEGKELPTRARLKVNTGDVIVSSIEGSLSSIALINAELNNALCSTGFYVVNSDTINSETLLVLLKSPVGQLQLKKGCSGTILTAINKEEFKQILLPDISAGIQKEIEQKISEMYKAKAASENLLDIAKRGVEMAIETDEKTALKWLK